MGIQNAGAATYDQRLSVYNATEANLAKIRASLANARSGGVITTLTSALNTGGGAITSLAVAALPNAIPAALDSSTTHTITDPTGAHTQTWLTVPGAAQGATSITVTSATPTFNFPIGSLVQFGFTPAQILCIGDSITQGVRSTPHRLYNWPAALRTILAADGRFGPVGEGIIFGGGQTVANYDERWTAAGNWTRAPGGLYSTMWQSGPQAGGGTLSLALPSCDHIRIWYSTHAINGTWTYNVDGGAPTSVAANGGSAIAQTTISVSAGVHTLNIIPDTVASPGSGFAMVHAIEYWTAASRNAVEVISGGGWTGTTSSNWNTANAGFDVYSLVAAIKPALVFICIGRNDAASANGVTPAQYLTNMTALATAFSSTDSLQVILVSPPPAAAANYNQDRQIRANLYAVSDALGLPLLDLALRFTTNWNTAPYNLSADNIHPTDGGSYAIANAVSNLLLA